MHFWLLYNSILCAVITVITLSAHARSNSCRICLACNQAFLMSGGFPQESQGQWTEEEAGEGEGREGGVQTTARGATARTLCEDWRQGAGAGGAHSLWICGMNSMFRVLITVKIWEGFWFINNASRQSSRSKKLHTKTQKVTVDDFRVVVSNPQHLPAHHNYKELLLAKSASEIYTIISQKNWQHYDLLEESIEE